MPYLRTRRVLSARHAPPASPEARHLPKGVRLLAWARTIRWIGWGFGENLIPIFLFAFSASYAEAGLFSSIYEIALLVALPVLGALADRTSAKVLVVAGLLIYPFVGIGYMLAGITGLAAFVVLARVVNGVAWGLDDIGIDTYYRRMADHGRLSSSFGFIESVAHVGWMGAGVVSLWLVHFIPVHYLLLAIAPFALLAIPFVLRAPDDSFRKDTAPRTSSLASYGKTLNEWLRWGVRLRLLGALTFVMGIITTLTALFIPIDAFVEGADLSMVVLLGLVASLPCLMAYPLGRIADGRDKYRLIAYGLFAIALIAVGLAAFPSYAFKLAASFAFGVLMELFVVANKHLVTVLGPEETYGLRGSAFESINTLGNIVAPLLLGVLFDALGFSGVALTVAGLALVLCLSFAALSGRRE